MGMVLALFAVFFIEWATRQRVLRGAIYAVCLGLILVSAGIVQRDSYKAHYAETVAAQAYAPLLTFLRTLPTRESVWADRTLSLYIPMYTKQDVPNHGFAQYDLVPHSFLEKRLLLEYALRKVTSADAFKTMQNEREDIAGRLYGIYWREQYGSYKAIPDQILEQYANDYKKSMQQSIPAQLSALGVSVVVWDTKSDPSWDIQQSLGTTPVFSNGRFEIYRLATSTLDGAKK
jgi:hypothetical protein